MAIGKSTKKTALLIALALLCLCAAGCSGQTATAAEASATPTASAVPETPEPTPEPTPTPEPVGEDGLTATERARFDEGAALPAHNALFYYGAVYWLPVAEPTDIYGDGRCYGYVVVRDMTLGRDELNAGYVELYIAPGVTVTIDDDLPSVDKDIHVEKGACLIINGSVDADIAICSDGECEINGDVVGSLVMSRGKMTVNGSLDAHFFSFAGAELIGGENISDCNIKDFEPPYECAGGKYGMWTYIHVLLEEPGAEFPG